jgi:hypothetical protein
MVHVKHLLWEEENIQHVARHDVTPDEVEEVCHGTHIAFGGKQERLLIVGLTKKDRLIVAVLERDLPPNNFFYYTVTARSADRKEEDRFRHVPGETDEKNDINPSFPG